jgi:hypothetical protein
MTDESLEDAIAGVTSFINGIKTIVQRQEDDHGTDAVDHFYHQLAVHCQNQVGETVEPDDSWTDVDEIRIDGRTYSLHPDADLVFTSSVETGMANRVVVDKQIVMHVDGEVALVGVDDDA